MGKARSTDPDTSKEAASRGFTPVCEELYKIILNRGLDGLTRSELEAMGYDLQTYSTRFSDLLDSNRIVVTGKRPSVNPNNARKVQQQIHVARVLVPAATQLEEDCP